MHFGRFRRLGRAVAVHGARESHDACPPADVLLKRASSNLVLCYVAELLACVLALVFIAVACVVVSVAIMLAITAVTLVVFLVGSPVIYVTTWCR